MLSKEKKAVNFFNSKWEDKCNYDFLPSLLSKQRNILYPSNKVLRSFLYMRNDLEFCLKMGFYLVFLCLVVPCMCETT